MDFSIGGCRIVTCIQLIYMIWKRDLLHVFVNLFGYEIFQPGDTIPMPMECGEPTGSDIFFSMSNIFCYNFSLLKKIVCVYLHFLNYIMMFV